MDDDIDIDLGDGHTLSFTCWHPDRKLNPQYGGIPDADKYGAIVGHANAKDGTPCEGCITFEGETQQALNASCPKWRVESWEPLTLSPSLLCSCGDHGFIRDGRWVRA